MAIIRGILWREDYLRQGLRISIGWRPEAAPHVCCFGTTGSGKTYALKLLTGKLVKYGKASNIYRGIKWVEDTLIQDGTFSLPGQKTPLKSDIRYEVILETIGPFLRKRPALSI